MKYLLLGLALGFGGGLAPGPLMALIIQATLRRGLATGLRIAASPLLTDGPLIVGCLLFLNALPRSVLPAFSLVGGAYVAWLGLGALRESGEREREPAGAPVNDLRQGMLTNILSPHPWLFWIVVGGPQLVTALHRSVGLGVVFVVGIYAALVGTKSALACAVALARTRFDHHLLERAARGAGVLLIGAGIYLFVQGVSQLA